jgi:hypothetical protein
MICIMSLFYTHRYLEKFMANSCNHIIDRSPNRQSDPFTRSLAE